MCIKCKECGTIYRCIEQGEKLLVDFERYIGALAEDATLLTVKQFKSEGKHLCEPVRPVLTKEDCIKCRESE